MSATAFHNVLAVLDGEPDEQQAVLERAIELAQVEHARLTLAKTRESAWLAQCACVFPLAVVPPAGDCEEHALDALARCAELVPQSVSVTTLLLGADVHAALAALLREGAFDLLVSGEAFLHRSRLRRALHRAGICTLAIARPPASRSPRASAAPLQRRPAPQT